MICKIQVFNEVLYKVFGIIDMLEKFNVKCGQFV